MLNLALTCSGSLQYPVDSNEPGSTCMHLSLAPFHYYIHLMLEDYCNHSEQGSHIKICSLLTCSHINCSLLTYYVQKLTSYFTGYCSRTCSHLSRHPKICASTGMFLFIQTSLALALPKHVAPYLSVSGCKFCNKPCFGQIPSTYAPERLDLLRQLEKVKEMETSEMIPEESEGANKVGSSPDNL